MDQLLVELFNQSKTSDTNRYFVLYAVAATAYIALFDVANLQPGETVLIHGAAGAVGQAAIQLVQHAGGKVIATVGSQKKRDLLKEEYGIEDDCIFSSRDVSFAADVARKTNGKGSKAHG